MHPVDQHVGRRIRERRLKLQMQQESIAEALGISIQQIHKYETGVNRVSASRLFEMSKLLSVGIDYFFQGLDGHMDRASDAEDKDAQENRIAHDQLKRIEIALSRIPRESLREKVVSLIEAMSSDSNELH